MEQVAIAARESSLRAEMELKRRMQEVREKLLLQNNYNYAPVFLFLSDERDGGFFMLLNME